ncbi:unnamed protein product [Allacma fusca]|uniref:Mediator of RNA polymerase II transcription subunit 14 n=1 Tax=Allacma fusca TaxID=39272 RepID=A0A8J2KDZ8_9HEXA|nr:unnamed protein product [Allacma fusca]
MLRRLIPKSDRTGACWCFRMAMMNPMMKQSFGGTLSPGHSGPPGLGNMDRTPLTPMSMSLVPTGQQQQMGPPANSISLALLIDFIVQRTYHELTVLAELLPRKTDMERKQEIFNFAARTRLLAVRLLALVKWASSAAKVDKSVHIMNFLEKQSMLFIDTADTLSRMARETLVHARLPNFHIPAAVEVLTTGTYNRLPTGIRERIVPPDPITASEKKSTLIKLNQVIQHRLVTTELPAQMRNLKIEQGRVVFMVDNEFQVSLTVLGDSPGTPWKIIDIEILVEDKDIGDGMSLVHNLQTGFILQLAQSRVDMSSAPLRELYNILHAFAQSLQLEVLYSQVLKLCRERLGDYLVIDEYTVGRSIILSYWKELSVLDPKAELGYRMIISVDAADPAQPLGVTHQPPLTPEEATQTGEGLKTNQLEKIMVHTIYLRSRNRLSELRKEIELALVTECTLQGSPPVLSIPILTPCLRSEQLLVSVNVNTGSFLVHVPQFDPSPPVVNEIQQTINTKNPNTTKLISLISTLRYWITERRCEKTLQHLPASAADRITLLKWDENQILNKIGPHRLTIKFQKHPYAILIVEFKEKEDYRSEMDYFFYLIIVKKASAEENEELPVGTTGAIPKFYLRPVTIIPLDTFVSTHGAYTEVDVLDPSERIMGKRKLGLGSNPMGQIVKSGELNPAKKHKHPAYFVPELAHIVALCDERLPFALMTNEFTKRDIIHSGCRVEANGTCLSVSIFQFPSNSILAGSNLPKNTLLKLHERLQSATVRSQMQLKGFRTWNLELKFNASRRIHGRSIPHVEKPVNFVHEMALSSEDHIPKIVDYFLEDWTCIAKLFVLVEKSGWMRRMEQSGHVFVKSYTWNKLTLNYGPHLSAVVNICYNIADKCFKLSFGGTVSHNPHTLMRTHFEKMLNTSQTCSLDGLMKLLNETYEPLYSLTKLPTTPQLGALYNRPQIPVATFVLIPQSPTHVRVVYLSTYCIDVHFQTEGLISIRDGAYSLFDKSVCVGELTPMQIPKAFLMKYVDENAVFRRRSQSEDDNPPSPISTLMMDMDHSVGTPTGSSSSFLANKPQSPAPGRSNPHTPASPHIQPTSTSFSPAGPSFVNLTSPPPLNLLSQPSPNPSSSMLPHPSPSPSSSLLPAPSPSGGPLSVPTPSPNPNPGSIGPGSVSAGTIGSLGGGHPSPFFHAADSSPAPVHSPWAAVGSVGSPVTSLDSEDASGGVSSFPGHPCSPLERFLGSSYLRRQLQRIVQSDEIKLEIMDVRGPGFLLFRSATMQFRVGHDINHHQTLNMNVTPVPEYKDQWSPEEIHVLQTFFGTKVVSPPFRPNGLAAFARMISLPPRILRDCIQILRFQLCPSSGEHATRKWNVQLCLTVPHSSMPIIPQGMPAIVTSASKILIYLYLTRVQGSIATPGSSEEVDPSQPERLPFVVIPLIYESTTNITQLAEKRTGQPVSVEYAAVSQQLKRFTEFNQASLGMECCSIFPAVQDLLSNLVLPPDGPPPLPPVGPAGGPPPQMPSMVRPSLGQQQFAAPHNPMGPIM